MSHTQKKRVFQALPDTDASISQDCRQLLEAMAGSDGSGALILEAPTDDPAAARVLWANSAGLFEDRCDVWPRLLASSPELRSSWEALCHGETIHSRPRFSWDVGLSFFHVTLVPLNSPASCSSLVRFGAILQNKTEQEQTQREMQDLMTRAHCLLWHAQVMEVDDQLVWQFDISNLAAALQWLPIRHQNNHTLCYSWASARTQEETGRMDETSRTAILSGAASYAQEFEVRLADGRLRHLAETVQIEPKGQGCWNLTGVCTDATERYEAEAEARDIMIGTHCLIWHADIVDVKGELIWDLQFSNTAAALEWLPIHCPEGMPLGWAWAMARPPAESERSNFNSATALRTGQPGYIQDFPVVLENGKTRLVHETVHLKSLEPGHWHAVGVCTDATERHEAEDEMRKLLTNVRCLIWHADVEGDPAQSLQWNLRISNEAEVQRWLPISVKPGQSFLSAWEQARLPEDQLACNRTCAAALRANSPHFAQEFRVRLAGDEVRWLSEEVQIEPLGLNHWRLVGVCTDITERKAEQETLSGIITRARCLVWHATVEERNGDFDWDLQISNSESVARWLAIQPLSGQSFPDAWYQARFPEDDEACDKMSESALRGGAPGYHQEFRCRESSGNIRWLAEDVHIEPLGASRWHLVGVCTDITERKAQQDALRDVITHARCLVWRAEVAADGENMIWDLQVFNEEAARRWLAIQVSPTQSFVDAWTEARFPEDIRAGDEIYLTALHEGKPSYSQEYRCLETSGQTRWLAEDVQVETVGEGRWRLFGVCTDITERKMLEEERERALSQALEQADRDPLTGLLNHRAFHAYLAREGDRAQRGGSVLGIAVIDLDNFKFFNDAYGHLSGDDVLRQVASALREVCRSYDTLARFGGDEFAVLMPGAGPSDVAHLAERLASCLENVRYRPPGALSDIPLSLSVGMAVFPQEAPVPLAALHLADERLLRVKSGERGHGAQAEQLRAILTDGVEGFSMLDALVVAVDNKDRYTRSHSEDVLFYCLQIAETLALEPEAAHQLQIAALLHDVGKIGIPDHILRKPGKLTEAEYGAMKQHPVMGAAIVAAVPGLEGTLGAVRHHHERWDGLGYPDGLAGETTPLEARIMAVADAFSAMTTDRPYRKGMAPEEARAVLEAGAGTQWDMHCVHAFLQAQRKVLCLKANIPLFLPMRA